MSRVNERRSVDSPTSNGRGSVRANGPTDPPNSSLSRPSEARPTNTSSVPVRRPTRVAQMATHTSTGLTPSSWEAAATTVAMSEPESSLIPSGRRWPSVVEARHADVGSVVDATFGGPMARGCPSSRFNRRPACQAA